jgi:ankyrin repeat protein
LLDRGAKFEIRDNAGDTPLSRAAAEGQTDAVKLLLDRGANIEASNNKGQTPLFEAAAAEKPADAEYDPDPGRKLHAATVTLLLERGANPDAKDHQARTPLEAALALHYDTIAADIQARLPRLLQLEQTQWKDPQEQFAATLSAYRDYPYIASLREKVVQLAIALPSPPAVPEDARKMAIAASQQVKTASTEAAFAAPIAMLRKALEIAPWWRDAYFNLSYALEVSGQYDDAARQLKTYLDLKPSEADAAKARARLLVIQMEKDAAPSK